MIVCVWSVPRVDAEQPDARLGEASAELRMSPDGAVYDLRRAACHDLPMSWPTLARIWLPTCVCAPLIGAVLASIPVTVLDGISTTLGWGPASQGHLLARPFDLFHLLALLIFLLLTVAGVVLTQPHFRSRAVEARVRAERGLDGTTRLRLVPAEEWEEFRASLRAPARCLPASAPDPGSAP